MTPKARRTVLWLAVVVLVTYLVMHLGREGLPPGQDATNLVLDYAFDASTGDTTPDESGQGHIGMLTNGALVTGQGIEGSALSCDGADDYVDVGTNTLLPAGLTDVTIALWVKPTNLNGFQALIGNKRGFGGTGWLVAIENATASRGKISWSQAYAAGLTNTAYSSIPLVVGTWTFVAIRVRESTATVWVGSTASTTTFSNPTGINVDTENVRVCHRQQGGATNEFYGGLIDNMHVWTRALTDQEVANLYTFEDIYNEQDLACDPAYRVCFTPAALINKAFPQPFHLTDLTATTRQDRPSENTMPGQYVNMLHYPGGLYRIQDRTFQNGGLALGFLDNVLDDTQGVQLFSLQGCSMVAGVPQKYEWRPDHTSYACSNGLQYQVMPITNQTILGNLSLRCTTPGCTITANGNAAGIAGTYNGYQGWQATTPSLIVYVLFSQPPTTLTNTQATFFDGYDGYVAVVMLPGLNEISNIFTNPHAYVVNATANYRKWYRERLPPSMETTNWGRERYYRSLNTYHYTLFQTYPLATTKLWSGHTAVSPGGFYMGVWIWDSFFAAWANIQTCITTPCVDLAMDALRILKENQYGGGQYPRQVEHYSRSPTNTWQAPGGWSFAVDQADTKFGTNYGAEFYTSLKAFHNFVRTTDSDGDGVFEWGSANTGWDNSPRWLVGNPLNAIDLQAWMILDAEALRNIAHRLGNTADETLWDSRHQAYIAAIQPFCIPGPYCYDKTRSHTATSTVLTPATYFLLMAGALSPAQATAMLPALYDTSLLGPASNGIGILPSVSRSDPNYDADGNVRTWGGPYWINLAYITYLGLLRYNLTTDAEYVRSHQQSLLQLGGVDMESYTSEGNVGYRPFGGFNSYYYGWTAAGVMIYSTPVTFNLYGDRPTGVACTSSWTCGAYGGCAQQVNTTWFQIRLCTDDNGCSPPTNPPQTTQSCTAPSCVVDADGDTYFSDVGCIPLDCDDTNVAVYPGATETCNNIDDNCDTYIDESLIRVGTCPTQGYCVGNYQTCTAGTWGACSILPLSETCNNQDDNCDGQIDEDLTQVGTCLTQGRCGGSQQTCASGIWGVCSILPITEVCEGTIDEDCNGVVDNGCTCTNGAQQACGTDTGACQAGTQTCTSGTWSSCVGSIAPTTELCNGLDDNCDGTTDDLAPQSCGASNVGACHYGQSACTSGAWSACAGNQDPIPEECNAIDDDCDGALDDNLIRSCSIGLNTGNQICAAGTWGTCVPAGYVTATCTNQSANSCVLDVLGTYLDSGACAGECQCSPSWSAWSAYSAGSCGTRTRTDQNDCGNSTMQSELLPCTGTSCGNDVIETGEICDGPALRQATCASVDDRYTSGVLGCLAECSGYALGDCVAGTPPLKYYGCSTEGACIAKPDGQYLSGDCAQRCETAWTPSPATFAIGGGTILVLVILLLVLWPKPGRRRVR